MCRSDKIAFIDNIVELLGKYCPQMFVDVKYFVACQFALESNFGKSRLAKVNNNYCGMCLPKSRLSLNIAVSGNFAAYKSLDDCVIDYCYWLAFNKINYVDLFNLNLYSRFLVAKKYCPESDYIDRIFNLFNSLKS